MIETLQELLRSYREPVYLLFRRLKALDRQFLLWSDLVHEYEEFAETEVAAALRDTKMKRLMRHSQEAVVDEPFITLDESLKIRMRAVGSTFKSTPRRCAAASSPSGSFSI